MRLNAFKAQRCTNSDCMFFKCSHHNYGFCINKQQLFLWQVVDMRWGVRDEAIDDHMTTELCMREIVSFVKAKIISCTSN